MEAPQHSTTAGVATSQNSHRVCDDEGMSPRIKLHTSPVTLNCQQHTKTHRFFSHQRSSLTCEDIWRLRFRMGHVCRPAKSASKSISPQEAQRHSFLATVYCLSSPSARLPTSPLMLVHCHNLRLHHEAPLAKDCRGAGVVCKRSSTRSNWILGVATTSATAVIIVRTAHRSFLRQAFPIKNTTTVWPTNHTSVFQARIVVAVKEVK